MTNALIPPRAVLIDFGGVLTSSVLDAIAAFGSQVCGDRELPLRLLSSDADAKRLHVEREKGRISAACFEAGFAARLRAHGATLTGRGLLEAIASTITLDLDMLDLVQKLRAGGVLVGLVSNSLGEDDYRELDLVATFDAVAISGREGVRKPSRRLYEIGCARLGVSPAEVVMVDDLRQNVEAAQNLGMRGVIHRSHRETAAALSGHFAWLAQTT